MPLLLRNGNLRHLFGAVAAGGLGEGIAALAFPWLATPAPHEAPPFAPVACTKRLPGFPFAIPAGPACCPPPGRLPRFASRGSRLTPRRGLL
jgi:hypothetical protein